MRTLLASFTLALLLIAPAVWAQGGLTSTFTNSISHTQTFHTTNNAAEVDNYLTRITARIGNGPLLYDQTFSVQVSDPTVQAAILQARTQLTNAGAVSITGPNQIANAKTLTGSMQNTVVNNTQITTDGPVTFSTIGSATIMIGDLGLCQGLTGTAPNRLPTGCAGGQTFVVQAGTINFNTNVNTQSDIFQTVTTTSTFQIAQTFELDGAAQTPPPGTPLPPSFWLTLTGLAGAGAYSLKRKLKIFGHRDATN